MGRPKKPIPLKVANGTHRPGRHGSVDSEVQPGDFGDTAPPADLGEIGVAKWVETIELLKAMKILTAADRDAITAYCKHHDRVAHYTAVLEKDGEWTVSMTGSWQKHPALNERRQAEMAIERFQKQYAMTAVSRAGLVAPQATESKPSLATRKRG
jgi:P27 family predicted phage terminase small subunit